MWKVAEWVAEWAVRRAASKDWIKAVSMVVLTAYKMVAHWVSLSDMQWVEPLVFVTADWMVLRRADCKDYKMVGLMGSQTVVEMVGLLAQLTDASMVEMWEHSKAV